MRRGGIRLLAACAVLAFTAFSFAQATQPAAQAEAKPQVITRVYDFRDLMMTIGDYPFAGRIGAPSEKDVVMLSGTPSNATTQPTRSERIDELIRLIQETVDADSWRDAGGTVGSIRELSGLLVVTQTAEAHKQIETLLGQLREDHLRTVRVQADWVMLTPEQARALLAGDSKNDGKVSARLIDPAALAKVGESIAFHAELSCFSGQTVSISAGRTRTAIVDQQAVVAQDAATLSPTVRQIQAGAMLQLTPTLETTLDTAVVDVHSHVADWTEPGHAEVTTRQTQATPTGVKMGGEGPATIDRLNLLTQEFRTTARVPVGKPVLIGGMSSEPSQTASGGGQLYLILQLTAGK